MEQAFIEHKKKVAAIGMCGTVREDGKKGTAW